MSVFNKKISTPIGILVIIVAIIFLIGGILAWHWWGDWYFFSACCRAIKAPKEMVEEETADWQIYTNEEYGFEIKYPEDWRVATSIMEWYREYISSPHYQALPEDWVMITNLSLEEETEYLGALRGHEGMDPLIRVGNADGRAIIISPATHTILREKEIKIPTGLTVFISRAGVMSGLGPEGAVKAFDVAAVLYPYNKTLDMPMKGEKITHIELKIEKSNENYEKAIFNQMLSTFRFLE